MYGNCYRSRHLDNKCLPYRHRQHGVKEKFVQSGIHTCSMMTTDPCVFSLLPSICSTGEVNAFLDLILTVDESYSFDYRLKQHNAEWRAQKVTLEENCTAQSSCSESHACHVLQPKWTHA